jgi:ribosomal protein S18 acetylase RimI-like enzyme
MDYKIVRVDGNNYSFFEDMIYWRMNGKERLPLKEPVDKFILNELKNPNLFVYAVEVEKRYVGWISLIYLPKIGKYNGSGYIYIDELWVHPAYRRNKFGYNLICKADDLKEEMNASGIRLYVNTDNPNARKLYEKFGLEIISTANLMEK